MKIRLEFPEGDVIEIEAIGVQTTLVALRATREAIRIYEVLTLREDAESVPPERP